jgi:hypothetical protein
VLTFTKDFIALRRTAALLAGTWTTEGRDIIDDEGNLVCTTKTTALADYICKLHAYWLPVTNAFVQLRKALRDRKAMSALLKHESASGGGG